MKTNFFKNTARGVWKRQTEAYFTFKNRKYNIDVVFNTLNAEQSAYLTCNNVRYNVNTNFHEIILYTIRKFQTQVNENSEKEYVATLHNTNNP